MRYVLLFAAFMLGGCGVTVYDITRPDGSREHIENWHGMMDWAMSEPEVHTASGATFKAKGTEERVSAEAAAKIAEGVAAGFVKGAKP